MAFRDLHGLLHEITKPVLVVDDAHGPAAKNVGWPYHHGVAYFRGDLKGLFKGKGRIVCRLLKAKLFEHLLKALPVFGHVDAFRASANDVNPCLFKGHCKVKGGLAAKLDNHPVWLLCVHDMKNVFQGQRLKVELVRCVIVR